MKSIAYIISVLFHPLLIPSYAAALLMLVNPYLFGFNNLTGGSVLLLRIFISTFLLPFVALAMMRGLNLVGSIGLSEREDRTGPMIATGIFYLWTFYSFYRSELIPKAYTAFLLGATIALFIAFFINIFEKVSLHTIGVGGLLGFVIITRFIQPNDTFQCLGMSCTIDQLLLASVLLCGIVGTSRLALAAHTNAEVYKGYIIGLSAQFIALFFIL